jgi:surfactin synthase thioesterase subunit
MVAPGRDHRRGEPALHTIAALADDLAGAVRSVADGPFALFGHSLGAAVAYEIARRLEGGGCGPMHGFVAGRGAPNTVPLGPPLADLDDAAFVAALQARYDAIPAPILADRELLALFLPTLRADLRLHERYLAPCLPLFCPITALGGKDDCAVRVSDLDEWAAFTRSRFERHLLPGGHFFVRDARAATLAVIARALRTELAVYE